MRVTRIIANCLHLGRDLNSLRPHLSEFSGAQLEALLVATVASLRWKRPINEALKASYGAHLFPKVFTRGFERPNLSRHERFSLIIILASELLALESSIGSSGTRKNQ